MKKRKFTAWALGLAMTVMCCVTGLVGCGAKIADPARLNAFADQVAMFMMGNDPFGWNVFSATPEQSFGYQRDDDVSWYTYSAVSKSDIGLMNSVMKSFNKQFKKFDGSAFTGMDAVTYRSIEYTLDTYGAYFGSDYAFDMIALSGSYISSEGGYVASFADSFENYTFRTEADVKELLAITKSTKDAFGTYLDFANDRVAAGYPLYDSTLDAMQSYLDDVLAKGDEYYLYVFADNKIDAVEFLSADKKTYYKNAYKNAIDVFMAGVDRLSKGLNAYKGRVENTDKSYLAAAGRAGKAYYEWMFAGKTGMKGVDFVKLFNELVDAYNEYFFVMNDIVATVDQAEESDPTLYADFNAYVNGEKVMLGMTDPTEILEYLKVAAKKIVPDLQATPEIDFKYMDETVAAISSTVAYYVKSPVDDLHSPEHITLNPAALENSPEDLLTVIAHEGYPGHLYARVKSKEAGESLLTATMTSLAFTEGWSKYVEIAVLENIAEETDDAALKLYAEYKKYDTLTGYISAVLNDLNVNYFGVTAQSLAGDGVTIDDAREFIGFYMEIPSAFVPYGYGMYVVYDLHETAEKALGEKYDEVKFNDALLSEGMGPTLVRIQQVAADFVEANKAE